MWIKYASILIVWIIFVLIVILLIIDSKFIGPLHNMAKINNTIIWDRSIATSYILTWDISNKNGKIIESSGSITLKTNSFELTERILQYKGNYIKITVYGVRSGYQNTPNLYGIFII